MDVLVSVLVPTYKRSDLLPRALDSILAQTYKNIEIVVVDDNPPESGHRKKTEAAPPAAVRHGISA